MSAADIDFDVEEVLLEKPEVFVYKIGAREGSSGHRAESWGLATPLKTLRLRVVSNATACFVQLVDKAPVTGDPRLFAVCKIKQDDGIALPLSTFLEPVIDSSRYYVLRIVDEASGRVAFLGIGFRERQCALDLMSCLQDQLRFWSRHARGTGPGRAPSPSGGASGSDSSTPSGPSLDYSLPSDATIRVSIGGRKGSVTSAGTPTGAGSAALGATAAAVAAVVGPAPGGLGGAGGSFSLRPPPAASSSIRRASGVGIAVPPSGTPTGSAGLATSSAAPLAVAVAGASAVPTSAAAPPPNSAAADDDDDFGDFVSA